jgi:hypothetical protein
MNYETALATAAVGVYVALRGSRALIRYLAGTLPAAILLGAYDWAAFGAPWHLSYRYIDNFLSGQQQNGFFGIAHPHLVQSFEVFAGPGGLLVASPVLVLAGIGLVLVGREYPAEAAVCGAVGLLFVFLNCGYFLPYGGVSPGPRFLIPALPFLALGLGPAFRRAPVATSIATVVSVVSMSALMLVWGADRPIRGTIFGELARVPSQLGESRFVRSLSWHALHVLGPGKAWGAAFVALAALAALAAGAASMPWLEIRARRRLHRPSRRATAVAIGAAYAIAAADVSAAFGYPYGNRTAGPAIALANIETSVSSYPPRPRMGDDVSVIITVVNKGTELANRLLLTIRLSSGLVLEHEPSYQIGSGCQGTSTVVCNLDYLPSGASTPLQFTARVVSPSGQSISALTTTRGIPGYNHPRLTIPVDG